MLKDEDFRLICYWNAFEASSLSKAAYACLMMATPAFRELFPDLTLVDVFRRRVSERDNLLNKLVKSELARSGTVSEKKMQTILDQVGSSFARFDQVEKEYTLDSLKDNPKWIRLLSELDDFKNIYRIDPGDLFSFVAVTKFSRLLAGRFSKLGKKKNFGEEDIDTFRDLDRYMKSLIGTFGMLVGYWSAKGLDTRQFHSKRTEKSTVQKRRNREAIFDLVVKEYRRYYNDTEKLTFNSLKENQMLENIRTLVVPLLKKEKKICREKISVSTLRTMLREAYKDGKIKHYPWIRNS